MIEEVGKNSLYEDRSYNVEEKLSIAEFKLFLTTLQGFTDRDVEYVSWKG